MDMSESSKKQILYNQSGYAAHGETLAIMGPSGAFFYYLKGLVKQRYWLFCPKDGEAIKRE